MNLKFFKLKSKNRILLYRKRSGVYFSVARTGGVKVLLMLIFSIFLFSCEDREPVVETPEKDLSGPVFSKMTEKELIEYFKNVDWNTLKANHDYFRVETLTSEEFSKMRRIKTRSTYECGMEVTLYLDAPATSADVTVYYAGTTTVKRAKQNLTDGQSFSMTIDGGEYYDFRIEDPTIPSASISGYLDLDPDWGSVDLEFFSGSGPHYVEDYNFVCPEPTDGTCEAAANIRKLGGTATSYTVVVLEADDTFVDVLTGFTGSPSQFKYYDIDETKGYKFVSQAVNGTTGSEDYSIRIVRPDAATLSYYYYGRSPGDSETTPVYDEFDCPY